MTKKKKIVYHSNFCDSKTGFGRHAKELLFYLYKTGKYDIVEYAGGGTVRWSDPILRKTPWKTFGVWPNDDNELTYVNNQSPENRSALLRMVSYGSHNIDKLMMQEKPDVYIGTEDIWAFDGYWNKKWWNKLTPVLHTTLDSLPILPKAFEAAKKCKNFLVWAKFAEEAMKADGADNVRTIHGAIDTKKFFRLSDEDRKSLRKHQNISEDAYIIGFVFRNQLRKSVPNLLQGFKIFKKENPSCNAKVLLHTNWEEKDQGWDIPRLIKELSLDPQDVLTTYICRQCGSYEVKAHCGDDANCRFCGSKVNPRATNHQERTGQCTTGVGLGVNETQLNEVYNLMDVYVHPFTSGGQEIPIQEAKLTELVTLVTNYSCGTEYCTPESGGLPLEWSEYREHGTQFIKASTSADSISSQLSKVRGFTDHKLATMGRKARKFVIENCGIEVIGKAFEKIIDEAPFCDWDFNFEEPLRNPNYPIPNIPDDVSFLKDIYKNILLMNVTDDDDGLKFWLNSINQGRTREEIYAYFVGEANRLNNLYHPPKPEDFFDKTENKRLLYVMPKSLGDCFLSTALFQSIKELYPDYDLYVGTDPQYFTIFDANPYVHKCIPYFEKMENEIFMIGHEGHKGYVDILFLPHLSTQRQFNYLRNGNDKFAYNIKGF